MLDNVRLIPRAPVAHGSATAAFRMSTFSGSAIGPHARWGVFMRLVVTILVFSSIALGQGTLNLSGVTVAHSGAFANSQMNEYVQSLLNGCSQTEEFQSVQGKSAYSTDSISGCVAVPASGTVHNANAVAGYANSASASQRAGGALGGYFQGRALVNGAGVWGSNSVVS